MSQDVKPRIRAPQSAKKGEIVEIRTLITHPMESGQRRDAAGQPIPRKIINRFTCRYNGRLVIDARLEPSIAANPTLSFFLRCTESGRLEFTWTDDDGAIYAASQAITVN